MKKCTCFAMFLLLCSIFVEGLNYYELLQLDRRATTSDIKRAYRSIALKYHPDKGEASESAMRTEFMKDVNAARFTLSDLEERAYYDLQLGSWKSSAKERKAYGDPFQNWLKSPRESSSQQTPTQGHSGSAFMDRKKEEEKLREFEEAVKRYYDEMRQERQSLYNDIMLKFRKDIQSHQAQERQKHQEYMNSLPQEFEEREKVERRRRIIFTSLMVTGIAGISTAVVESISYFLHRGSQKRCNACITHQATEFKPVADACSNSISNCKSYYLKLADHCKQKCSTQQVMQPMNSYLHKIMQNQSESMFQLIQNSSSMKELQPAVAYAIQLKDVERKTRSNSRFRKSLSAKVEQAIKDKVNMLNEVVPI